MYRMNSGLYGTTASQGRHEVRRVAAFARRYIRSDRGRLAPDGDDNAADYDVTRRTREASDHAAIVAACMPPLTASPHAYVYDAGRDAYAATALPKYRLHSVVFGDSVHFTTAVFGHAGNTPGSVVFFNDVGSRGRVMTTAEARWSIPWDDTRLAVYVLADDGGE